jgi:SAM-dependent methyltransferase
MTQPKERWASGDLYEPFVGRWSRLVAQEFLAWLDAPARLDWLDVGCGTGALTEAVADGCAPTRLVGIDPSAGFLDFARQRLRNAADFRQADAQDLPFAAGDFDRVISGLVLNFVPDQPRAAAEMARVARPGGEAALYVWDYAGGMELLRHFWDAAGALDERARPRRGSPFPDLPAGAVARTVRGRGSVPCRDPRHRRPHEVPRLRRLLDAVPGRPGTGAGLLHVLGGECARRAARTTARLVAHAARRQHRTQRASFGGPRRQGRTKVGPHHETADPFEGAATDMPFLWISIPDSPSQASTGHPRARPVLEPPPQDLRPRPFPSAAATPRSRYAP